MSKKPPTEKQAAVLRFFCTQLDKGRPPPTLREICNRMGWSSLHSAALHVNRLVDNGYLVKHGVMRATMPTTKGRSYVEGMR